MICSNQSGLRRIIGRISLQNLKKRVGIPTQKHELAFSGKLNTQSHRTQRALNRRSLILLLRFFFISGKMGGPYMQEFSDGFLESPGEVPSKIWRSVPEQIPGKTFSQIKHLPLFGDWFSNWIHKHNTIPANVVVLTNTQSTAWGQNGQTGYNMTTNGSVIKLENQYYYATIMRPGPALTQHFYSGPVLEFEEATCQQSPFLRFPPPQVTSWCFICTGSFASYHLASFCAFHKSQLPT